MSRDHVIAALLSVAVAMVACRRAGAEEAEPVRVRSVAFSPDGKHLVAGFGTRETAGGFAVLDLNERRATQVVPQEHGVSSLDFSADGQWLAYSIYGLAARLVRWPSLDEEVKLDKSRRGPVAFSPDGRTLATGTDDFAVRLYDLASQSDGRSLSGHATPAYSIRFSPDGRQIASAARSGVVVWDLATGEQVHTFQHGGSLTSDAVFSPDGRWLITAGWDGTARLWNAASGELRGRFKSGGGADGLALIPQVNLLATHGTGRLIQLLALTLEPPTADEAAEIATQLRRLDDDDIQVREAASASLIKLGLVADAELATAAEQSPSAEVRIRARRARKAIYSQPLAVLEGHQGRIYDLKLSPDGKRLASCGDDGTVRVWDVAGRTQVALFEAGDLMPAPDR